MAAEKKDFFHLCEGLSQVIATSSYLIETRQHPDHKCGWDGYRIFRLFEHNRVAL